MLFKKNISIFVEKIIKPLLNNFNINIVWFVCLVKFLHFGFPSLICMLLPFIDNKLILKTFILCLGFYIICFIILGGCWLTYIEKCLDPTNKFNVADPYLTMLEVDINYKTRKILTSIGAGSFIFIIIYLVLFNKIKLARSINICLCLIIIFKTLLSIIQDLF